MITTTPMARGQRRTRHVEPCIHVRRASRGAATLVVVMSLLFAVTLMAAYANRNLLFEQRIAASLYRAALAHEMADAGADWALAQLNGIHTATDCSATSPADSGFRERYLNVDAQTRMVAPKLAPGPMALVADCRRLESGWTCRCPAPGHWSPPAAVPPSTSGLQPSFGVRLTATGRPGVLRIHSTGCSASRVSDCLSVGHDGLLGASQVELDAALVPALKMPPAVPLTARGAVDATPQGVGLHNDDQGTQGMLLHAGGAVGGLVEERLTSLPGTPGRRAVMADDGRLAALTSEALFRRHFGMSPSRYVDLPSLRRVVCSGDCTASLLRAAAGGARLIWIDGPLDLSGPAELGSEQAPIVIVANGFVTLHGPVRITGLLYARADLEWTHHGEAAALLQGALIGEGSVRIAGHVDLWYRPAVMRELNNRHGSFVRVPGSWWN